MHGTGRVYKSQHVPMTVSNFQTLQCMKKYPQFILLAALLPKSFKEHKIIYLLNVFSLKNLVNKQTPNT